MRVISEKFGSMDNNCSLIIDEKTGTRRATGKGNLSRLAEGHRTCRHSAMDCLIFPLLRRHQ